MVKREKLKKAGAIGISITLLLLILTILTQPAMAVYVHPGTPSGNVVLGNTVTFSNVNLTIRNAERIDISYLKFAVYRSSTDTQVAYVKFSLQGTETSDSPSGKFTVTNLTDTSNLPYSTGGSSYGYDEQTNQNKTFGYGYGYNGSGLIDLTVLYTIVYTTHTTGTFYAKLSVNSTIHTYTSASSSTFTVSTSGSPSGPGGGTTNSAPTADAGGPYSANVGQSVTFDGSGSTDSDGSISYYRWDYTNDGTYDTGWSTSSGASHSYSTAGSYTVKLQVKDNEGATATDTAAVTISESGTTQKAPSADAGGPYTGLTSQTITFDGSGSTDSDGTISSYSWSFGDGSSGTGVSPTHVYTTADTFTVTLTVTDNDGLSDSAITTATIELDSDADGWSDDLEDAYGTDKNNSEEGPTDTDGDGTPDEDSPDGSYMGDTDDDNDGLSDELEAELGTDSGDSGDVTTVDIQGSSHYIIDTDNDGYVDSFYNSELKLKTSVNVRDDGKYDLDIDGDGEWDYIYDPALGTLEEIEEEEEEDEGIPLYVWIILIIVVIIIVILYALFKSGYLYIEEVEEKTAGKKETPKKKETEKSTKKTGKKK